MLVVISFLRNLVDNLFDTSCMSPRSPLFMGCYLFVFSCCCCYSFVILKCFYFHIQVNYTCFLYRRSRVYLLPFNIYISSDLFARKFLRSVSCWPEATWSLNLTSGLMTVKWFVPAKFIILREHFCIRPNKNTCALKHTVVKAGNRSQVVCFITSKWIILEWKTITVSEDNWWTVPF